MTEQKKHFEYICQPNTSLIVPTIASLVGSTLAWFTAKNMGEAIGELLFVEGLSVVYNSIKSQLQNEQQISSTELNNLHNELEKLTSYLGDLESILEKDIRKLYQREKYEDALNNINQNYSYLREILPAGTQVQQTFFAKQLTADGIHAPIFNIISIVYGIGDTLDPNSLLRQKVNNLESTNFLGYINEISELVEGTIQYFAAAMVLAGFSGFYIEATHDEKIIMNNLFEWCVQLVGKLTTKRKALMGRILLATGTDNLPYGISNLGTSKSFESVYNTGNFTLTNLAVMPDGTVLGIHENLPYAFDNKNKVWISKYNTGNYHLTSLAVINKELYGINPKDGVVVWSNANNLWVGSKYGKMLCITEMKKQNGTDTTVQGIGTDNTLYQFNDQTNKWEVSPYTSGGFQLKSIAGLADGTLVGVDNSTKKLVEFDFNAGIWSGVAITGDRTFESIASGFYIAVPNGNAFLS